MCPLSQERGRGSNGESCSEDRCLAVVMSSLSPPLLPGLELNTATGPGGLEAQSGRGNLGHSQLRTRPIRPQSPCRAWTLPAPAPSRPGSSQHQGQAPRAPGRGCSQPQSPELSPPGAQRITSHHGAVPRIHPCPGATPPARPSAFHSTVLSVHLTGNGPHITLAMGTQDTHTALATGIQHK